MQAPLRKAADEIAPLGDDLIAEHLRAQQRSDHLFALVPSARLLERPIAERHRLGFYLGHLEAFDVNLLLHCGDSRASERLDRLFAFGIDPIDGDLPDDRPEDWPPTESMREYAARARTRVAEWLQQPSTQSSAEAATRLQAAIEHRWMHAETLAYLLNRLPGPRPVRAVTSISAAPNSRSPDRVAIPSGSVLLGRREGYGWDNEFGAHRFSVPAFRIDRTMVSNAQFLGFIESGGYREPRHWSDADWRWRETHSIEHPLAWTRDQDRWLLVSRADLIPLPGDWPVYVSHAEASAYARWSGRALPSEAQWQRAAYGDSEDENGYPWGAARADPRLGNFDFARWDPMPVDAHPAGASPFGVEGLLGNGWEWTRTPFAPFAGFTAAAFYRNYSAAFFDGRHYVLKGGSAHTAERLLRASFRNWFQPHYPHVFAGFRCVSEI